LVSVDRMVLPLLAVCLPSIRGVGLFSGVVPLCNGLQCLREAVMHPNLRSGERSSVTQYTRALRSQHTNHVLADNSELIFRTQEIHVFSLSVNEDEIQTLKTKPRGR
jgi:hypothetical protein